MLGAMRNYLDPVVQLREVYNNNNGLQHIKMNNRTDDLPKCPTVPTHQVNNSNHRNHNINNTKNTKILHIDISKVDKLSCLNKKEKRRLKKLLYELKCKDNKDEVTRKFSKSRKPCVPVTKQSKTKKTLIKSDNNHDTIFKRSITTKENVKTKIDINMSLDCIDCRKALENVNINKVKLKRKPRIPATTITVSDQKLLESFIRVDKRSHGDSTSSLLITEGQISPTINSMPAGRNNINIKNLELKYINPTYVLQYSSDVLEHQVSCQRGNYCFADTNMESTVRTKPALMIKGDGFHGKDIHPVPVKHIVGIALTPGVNNTKEPHLTETSPEGKKHVKDPLPSYLLPPEERAGNSKLSDPRLEDAKKRSACKTLTNYIKRCLCLSSGRRSRATSTDIEAPMSKMDKAEYVKHPSGTPDVYIPVKKPSKEEQLPTKVENKNNSKYVKFKSTVNIND